MVKHVSGKNVTKAQSPVFLDPPSQKDSGLHLSNQLNQPVLTVLPVEPPERTPPLDGILDLQPLGGDIRNR